MTHRALRHAQAANELYPRIWQAIDAARDGATWPKWCFVPIGTLAPIVAADPHWVMRPSMGMIADVARLAAISAWRTTQTIYRFDATLLEALRGMSPTTKLPAEVLLLLPEWCIYLETPGVQIHGQQLHGCFAHCEWDDRTGRGPELRLLLDTDDELFPVAIPLQHETLIDALASVSGPWAAWIAEASTSLVSMLLYLCSVTADIGEHRPLRPSTTRTKRGPRLFPAQRPIIVDTGVRIGAAIRRAQASSGLEPMGGTNEGPLPHWRRAHWHSYWVGPADSKRLELRWLPPIPVKIRGGIMRTTIRLVDS